MTKRFFDFFLAIILLIILLIPMIIIGILIKILSSGNALHWSDRIGKDNQIFKMPKFRTMILDTPDVATHLLDNPDYFYTPIGRYLRRSSLDELPQLFSVLRGQMSFIGPRPALYNQDDLMQLRTKIGIHKLKPGITGWAQVNGRDEIPIPEKVALEEEYLNNKSWRMDLYILWLTFIKVIIRDNITH
tara:strand:- start:71 stop:634 length:564 start_codon:yes stop_codon:yes gene_type:complete